MRVVAGEARGRPLVAPPGRVTRAATARVRESLFAIIESRLEPRLEPRLGPRLEGARVLDLFAGAGTLGIEALSRGAREATFVERDARAVAALRRNLAATGFADRSRVVERDVVGYLASAPAGSFDLVFCDPPFADVAGLAAVLAHGGLRGALAPAALVVARAMHKHPPVLPEGAVVDRTREIGEETLYFLRYDAPRPSERP